MKTTQTKSWLLIRAAMMALLLGVATQVNAWGSLSLPSFDIAPGETKTLAIQFEDNKDVDYVAFQFDLYLPEGLTIVKQENGKPDLRFNEERKDDHTFSSATQADGALRVFGISLNNSSFSGTEGDFIYFTVTAADDFDGDHEVLLKKVMFSTAQGQRDELSDNIATATARHWTFHAETGHLFVNDDYEYVPWESHKTEIKTVEFGHNVTSIGSSAFSNCSSLTAITIPDGVTCIGENAFSDCSSLTSVTIPEGVTSIGDWAFWGCSSLTSITIPEGVTSIEGYAFSHCSSLISITIPEGVTHIEEFAFYFCTSLGNVTLPDGLISIGNAAFWGCKVLSSINIPASVTNIGDHAFSYCYKLSNITIPEGVETIKEGTFINCSALTSITIPANVTAIEDLAFYECPNLKEVINLSGLDIVKGAETHGRVALYADKVWTRGVHLDCTERGLLIGDQFTLEATVIPAGPLVEWSTSDASIATVENGVVTGVGEGTATITATAGNCWATCTVTVSKKVIPVTGIELNKTSATIIIGNTLTLEATVYPGDATDKTVTWNSSNTSVATVDNNGVVTPIADGTATITATAGGFSATCTVTVKGWSFDAGRLYVNENYYYYSPESYPWHDVREQITSVEFGPKVTIIWYDAFCGCSSLTSIDIPTGVTGIGGSAFHGCSSLATVTIPEGVTYIEYYAFYGCSSLTTITIPESVTSIGYDAFCGCSSLTTITIPKGVTDIEPYAFYECSSLTNITIPEGVTSIGEWTFGYCSKLESVTIPVASKLTSIGNDAFYNCSSLTNITIPEGVTSIGEWTFYNCSSLTDITIPADVESIGDNAFYGCENLKTVINLSELEIKARSESHGYVAYYTDCVWDGGANDWNFDATTGNLYVNYNFDGASAANYPWHSVRSEIKSVNIGSKVTKIGYEMFTDCINLTSITIPNGVTSIGNFAFNNCSSLNSITIPASVTDIQNNALLRCPDLSSIIVNSGNARYRDVDDRALVAGDTLVVGCTSGYIPEGVTVIGDMAFMGRVLDNSTLEIPEGVTSIERYAFVQCKVNSIHLPKTLKKCAYYSFCATYSSVPVYITEIHIDDLAAWFDIDFEENSNPLETGADFYVGGTLMNEIITTPEGLTVIKEEVLSGWKGHELIISEGVETISNWAFYGMKNLTTITIPSSVTTVGTQAFMECGTLQNVYCYAENVPVTQNNAFEDTNIENATLYVPEKALESYQSTAPWSSFGNFASMGVFVTGIELNQASATIIIGNTLTLEATVTPADATDKTVTWSTSDASIATVENGVVTGVGEGTATITATAGGFFATCNVTVEEPELEGIASIGELSNAKLYHVSQPHHSKGATAWAVAGDGTALKSNKDLGLEIGVEDSRQHFAFIKHNDRFYLYHAAKKKFVNRYGTLEEYPIDAINFENGAYDKTFVATFGTGYYVNVGGSQQLAIDNWSTADGGNSCQIVPAGDFDPTEALAAFITIEEQAPITSIDELSNAKAYQVTLPNHSSGRIAWMVAENGSALVSNSSMKLSILPFDAQQQFAFITPDDGETYYLYHMGKKQFVRKDGTLDENPVDTIGFVENSAYSGTFMLRFDEDHYVNIDGGGTVRINDWKICDGGNSCAITPVGDFDLTEALVHFVTGVELSENEATLTEDRTMVLTATIAPSAIDGITVQWTTSDAAIATVENGVVTAVAAGEAIITATVGSHSDTCNVTVKAAVVEPEPELEGLASISELSNDKLYLVAQFKRGNTAWAVAENGEALKSNVDLSIGVDAEDSRQHFAFIKHNDRFYLYHAAEKMFVSKDGSLNVQPVDAINITESTVFAGTFVVSFNDTLYINVNDWGGLVIDDWATHDGGNSCTIVPVGDFDPTEALKELNNFDTIIENAELKAQPSTIYDLMGRRVLSTEGLKGGVYIIDGVKVVIK